MLKISKILFQLKSVERDRRAHATTDWEWRTLCRSFIRQPERVARKANEVSAADWRYQTRVKNDSEIGGTCNTSFQHCKLLNAVQPKSVVINSEKPPMRKFNTEYSTLLYTVKCNRNNCSVMYLKLDGVFSKVSYRKKIMAHCYRSKMIYKGYIECFIRVNYIWQTLLSTFDVMYDLYIHLWIIFSYGLCQSHRISMMSDSLTRQLYVCCF